MPVDGPNTTKTKTVTIVRPCFIKNLDGTSKVTKVGDTLTLGLNDANLLIGNGQAVEGDAKVNPKDEQYKRWEQKEAEKKAAEKKAPLS